MKYLIVLVLSLYSAYAISDEDYFSKSSKDIISSLVDIEGKNIAVTDILNFNKERNELGVLLETKLTKSLLKVKNSDNLEFRLITRSKIEQILEEKKLIDKGKVNTSNDPVGIVEGVDILITGIISEDGKNFSINLEAISSKTGELLATAEEKIIKEPYLVKLYEKISNIPPIYGRPSKLASNNSPSINKYIDNNPKDGFSVKFNRCIENNLEETGVKCYFTITDLKKDREIQLFTGASDNSSYLMDEKNNSIPSSHVCYKQRCVDWDKYEIQLTHNRPVTIYFFHRKESASHNIDYYVLNFLSSKKRYSFSFGDIKLEE